ncbi:Zinc finger protein 62 [Lucilia cuprina]|nr:Zinc finger protein 62 [Lucilia cuprina]
MSCKNVKNNNTITKKCGEITITMKKNAKNIYSFNCWFCDTICVQMKKFSLHLEQEHVNQLEEKTSAVAECKNEKNLDDKIEIQREAVLTTDNILIGEIKIEDYESDDIKLETEEEKPQIVTRSQKNKLSPTFHDPLETCNSIENEIILPVLQENKEEIEFKINNGGDKELFEDMDTNNYSDDEYVEDSSVISGDDNFTESDNNIEDNTDEELVEAKEKDFILALIESYYQKTQLWNTSRKCRPKVKRVILQNITDEVNLKLKSKFKVDTVTQKLNLICRQYEKVIKYQLKGSKKKKHTKLWFSKHMSFLKTIIESKLKSKRKKTYTKVKPLSDDLLCIIIDIYKNYNSLWNVNHVAYPIKEKRFETLESMLDDVNKILDTPIDVDNLEKHLLYIHKSYSQDKQLKLECEAKQQDFQPTYSFSNKCSFLEDHQGPFKCPYCKNFFLKFKDFFIHKSQHDGSDPFKCQECGTGFKAHGNYTIHVKRHLGVLKFRCEICGKGYPVNSELEFHMSTHNDTQPYLCSICGESFRTSAGYDNHIRRHEERFRHYCDICKKGFNCLTTLTDHVNAHLNVRDFICNVCGKSFTAKKYLMYHRRIHGSKNYRCNICGKSYAQDAGLRQHKKQHGIPIGSIEIIITMKNNAKNVYSFNCWFCDTICIQMKKFTLHLEQEHITQLEQATAIVTDTNNEDNLDDKLEIQKETAIDSIFVGEIKIEDCFNDNSDDLRSELGEEKSQVVTSSLWNVNHVAYPIKQKRDESLQSMVEDVKKKIDIPLDVDKLEKHLLHIHNSFSKDKEVKLKCEGKHIDFRPTCTFYNKCDFLEEHQGPFKCPYCSEIHMQYKDFQIHKSQHDGSIPFKCQECGMGFKASGNYTLHVKRHLGVFRYRCNICDKGYPLNSELTLHMRSHTGAQPYLCSICGEGFRAAIGYDNHMRRHEERFRYHCQICKRGFNVLATLRDHVNAHLNVRNFVCKDCGKSFTSKKYLQYHSRIHGSKNYTCNICGKSYAQDAGLRQHKRHMHATRIPASIDNILLREIKVEDCDSENIKSETSEEKLQVIKECNEKEEVTPRFQDPLETFEDNHNGISLPISEVLINQKASKLDTNEYFEKIQPTEDVEMHYFSADEQHDYHSDLSDEESSDSDFKIEDNVDDKLMKPFKQSAKSKEKELILGLIDAYYKNPQLWDTTLMERCNLKQKDDILQTITDELNANLKMKLKLYMVKKKLNFICKQYEKEIERQINENDNSKESQNSELWFFENMSFLKSTIENKLKLKRKKPKHKVKPLNDNLLSELIDIYKNYNSLWDVNHIAYTVKDKRHETMESMLEDINTKMNLTLDIYKLEKHLHFIHKSFAKEKHHKLECQIKQEDFHPSCSYFNKCDFLESNQGPFKCPNCNEIIETYNDFQVHKSQHDGSVPFKCQECGMGFKKVTNYTIHAKRHLRVFKFHCEICGKGYPFNAELDLHMRSHTGAQPYLCSVCGEGFRTAISYDNHIRRHEERFKYFCHICKKGFNHMTRLNDHVKAHLNVRDVICAVCGKGFTSRKYLNHHKRIHEGKNYSCNICGKSFAQDAGLRAHKKYHGTPIGISSIQKEQNKYNLL